MLVRTFLLMAFLMPVFFNCNAQQKPVSKENAKYRIVILYPGGEDKTFDMDYYEKKHMPMVAGFIGKNLLHYEIDKGISGRTTNDKAPFMAIGYFYVNDISEYNKAIAQNRDAIVNDFRNYTNTQPLIQINEIRPAK